MERTSLHHKKAVAKLLSAKGRPIQKIEKLTKGNSSPRYNSKSLLKRSSETAKKRAARYNRVLSRFSGTQL